MFANQSICWRFRVLRTFSIVLKFECQMKYLWWKLWHRCWWSIPNVRLVSRKSQLLPSWGIRREWLISLPFLKCYCNSALFPDVSVSFTDSSYQVIVTCVSIFFLNCALAGKETRHLTEGALRGSCTFLSTDMRA